tara:strand:- start:1781 stop:2599 length:819 start_codon:yes stop_codon:yes gene_type:complete
MRILFLIYIGVWTTSCGTNGPVKEYSETDATFNQLVWYDEFDQETLDTTKWSAVIGDGCPELCGFGNNELQYYTDAPENVKISDGNLVIQAKRDTLGSASYTSAKLISRGKGDWKYGRFEFRARIPNGKGTWPALWMMPSMERNIKWPDDGEIDIMEHVGYDPGVVHGAIHTKSYNGMLGTQKVDSLRVETASDEFHVYALEWESDRLVWYIDETRFFELRKEVLNEEDWVFDKPFHLIMNLAVGGNWGGRYGVDASAFPQTLEVDYVRVYQ